MIPARLVDYEKCALADAFAVPVSAVSLGNGALRLEVSQERKMQIAMLRKCFVAPHAIHRNPEQLGA